MLASGVTLPPDYSQIKGTTSVVPKQHPLTAGFSPWDTPSCRAANKLNHGRPSC
jgi:hypothetical protein